MKLVASFSKAWIVGTGLAVLVLLVAGAVGIYAAMGGFRPGHLIEEPTLHSGRDMALILSGDGGWADLDKDLAERLVERSVPTLGFDVFTWFWKQRTPEEATKAVVDAVHSVSGKWKTERVLLIGYSFGASALPALLNRMPAAFRDRISIVVLLSPNDWANWEVRPDDWWKDEPHEEATLVLPEALRVSGPPVLCLYGEEEAEASLCPKLPQGDPRFTVIRLPGGHHFDEDYERLADRILEERFRLAAP